MAQCFPSRAAQAWGTFHLLQNSLAVSLHCSGVVGQMTTSSYSSSTMAWHTTGRNLTMVVLATRKSYCRVEYLSPLERCLNVTASFRPGSKSLRKFVSCSWILGPTLFSNSSNISGGILMKLKNDCWSSCRSSSINLS